MPPLYELKINCVGCGDLRLAGELKPNGGTAIVVSEDLDGAVCPKVKKQAHKNIVDANMFSGNSVRVITERQGTVVGGSLKLGISFHKPVLFASPAPVLPQSAARCRK